MHFLRLIFDYLSWEQVVAVGVEIPWEQQFNFQSIPWKQARIMRIRSRNMSPRKPRNEKEKL
ncbi:hypothetical protein DDW08_02765 [Vulcanisaeta sp. SCGC AB-777_J10]|nr:hypothetical protein DDW08_02765 [Vulcanisaeta sp. SCGC AB-777_J10]